MLYMEAQSAGSESPRSCVESRECDSMGSDTLASNFEIRRERHSAGGRAQRHVDRREPIVAVGPGTVENREEFFL
jgi:hypothetical protein